MPFLPSSRAAFSLVEVTLSLGLAAFVLVALLALASNAFRAAGESSMKLEAATAAAEVATRWRSVLTWNSASDTTTLAEQPMDFPIDVAIPNAGQSVKKSKILVNSQGIEASVEEKQRFQLDYQITRTVQMPMMVQLHLRLSWSILAENPMNSYELVTSVLLGDGAK